MLLSIKISYLIACWSIHCTRHPQGKKNSRLTNAKNMNKILDSWRKLYLADNGFSGDASFGLNPSKCYYERPRLLDVVSILKATPIVS